MADELFDAKSADGSFNLVNPSPCPLKAEGASSFNQLLQDHGISQELTDRLLADGWDAKSFRHVVCQESELAGVLPEMFPDTEVSLMQRAKLRAVWSSLQRRGSNEPAPAEPLGSPAKQGSGWSEAFAPKLDATRVATLKKRFLEAFPSEILTAMNTPSLRLLSTAVDAEVKKNWSWIPWKSRMTQQMYEDSLMQKPAKRARIETLQLSDLLLDEPPQIDINDSTMGISMIRRLLEVHDNALALAGTAHLARLKAYTSKFLSLVSQKFPPETNLRPPSVLEAQQADKHLWSCIFQLVIEKEWQVNDAIYEFTEIRGDMSSWLQPRAKAASAGNRRPYTPGGRDNRPPTPPPGRGNGKGKGKAKSPTKQGTQPRGVPWVREYKEGGQVKKLCIGWQIGKCQRGNSCEFTHGCAFPKPDGSPCLSKDHGVAGSIHSWGELPAPPPLPPPFAVLTSFPVTIALPELCRDLNALFRFLFPNERWNALCVSRNGLSALHSDSANIPGSRNLSLSLGAFSGGHLWIEDLSCLSQGQPTSVASGSGWLHGCAIDTHRKAISFDGRIRHMTLPFSGERWALTAFSLPDVCCAELERPQMFLLRNISLQHSQCPEYRSSSFAARERPRVRFFTGCEILAPAPAGLDLGRAAMAEALDEIPDEVLQSEDLDQAEEASGWDALPALIRRQLSANGQQISDALLWNMFLSEDEIGDFMESAGFVAGSVEWYRYSGVLVELWKGAELKAALASRNKSVLLGAHHAVSSGMQVQVPAAVQMTRESLISSAAVKRQLHWPCRLAKKRALARNEGGRAQAEAEELQRWRRKLAEVLKQGTAWQVVTGLQRQIVVTLCQASSELVDFGLDALDLRLQERGASKENRELLQSSWAMPSEWAAWRRGELVSSPPQQADLPRPVSGPSEPNFAFYVTVLGKRRLRRLHRKAGCGTQPAKVQCVEYYESLKDVQFDSECRHCFPSEKEPPEEEANSPKPRMVRRYAGNTIAAAVVKIKHAGAVVTPPPATDCAPRKGDLSSALHELAQSASVSVTVEEFDLAGLASMLVVTWGLYQRNAGINMNHWTLPGPRTVFTGLDSFFFVGMRMLTFLLRHLPLDLRLRRTALAQLLFHLPPPDCQAGNGLDAPWAIARISSRRGQNIVPRVRFFTGCEILAPAPAGLDLAWLHQGNCALILIPPLLYSDSAIPCQPQLLAASYRPLSALAVSSPAFAPPQCASAFASSFATIAAPLLPAEGRELSLQSVIKSIPRKGLFAGPHALHDGAGKRSIADWSSPASHDAFRGLRKALLQFCISARADKRLLARGSCPSNEPLFSSSEVSAARDLVFPSLGMQTPDNAWYVHPYQPMCLHAFEALAQHCGDQDIHLFPHLRMGVPTGYLNDIPPSNCFWPPKGQSGELIPLALNLENWKSADVAPEVTSRLLQEELDAGYCFKFEGTLEEAKSRWPVGLALGKLGVVRAPGRAERLVLDNSVAGTNSQCTVPERQCFPSIHDVSHSFPIRETSDRQMAICIDVKQAHKRCRIRDSEQGLLGFTWHNALYFFRCCPFGAVFSQHWWGRVGGCTLRLLHTLLFLAHVGLLFVDDFIFSQAASLMPLSGAVICLFLQILGVPVSWKKLQTSCRVDWIGWRLCFSSGTVSLREEKRLRLLEQVRSLLRGGGRISTKELESFLGLAMWACALFPTMRAMMHPFYKDLWSPAATNFSIAPESWHSICNFLDSSLRFKASPPHTAIPAGAKLLSARHVPFTTLADLSKVAVTHKRLWLRVECLSSSRRKLSCASIRSLQAFERWLQHVAPLASMRPSQVADVEAFADASEFEAAGIPFGNDLAKEIASCEALAQAGLNKMFSTKFPLGLVLEHIALLAAMHRISIDVSHVPGAKNCKADALSRPAEYPTPPDCLPCQRIRFGLSALWEPCPEVQIFPSSFTLPWLR
ncbi:unnamed protein product [Symbiodinium sp. CCMP2592]|nr:unnamed protein product [Symbiodinium sp. CCMP2592]